MSRYEEIKRKLFNHPMPIGYDSKGVVFLTEHQNGRFTSYDTIATTNPREVIKSRTMAVKEIDGGMVYFVAQLLGNGKERTYYDWDFYATAIHSEQELGQQKFVRAYDEYMKTNPYEKVNKWLENNRMRLELRK